MEFEITEKEFREAIESVAQNTMATHQDLAVAIVDSLGMTFKQEIDWEAETHDPSVIPDGWLVEGWDIGDSYRWIGLLDKYHGYPYDNYRAIKKEDWPEWAVEAHKGLED